MHHSQEHRIAEIKMAFKVFVLAALVAVARAGIVGSPAVVAPGAPLAYGAAPALAHAPFAYAAPAVAKVAAVDTDYDPNPQYSYSYDIQDALTGDSKGQQESRSGDVVQGSWLRFRTSGLRFRPSGLCCRPPTWQGHHWLRAQLLLQTF
ncbi:Cuticle protein [Zootermopsis nevadensis]|uniref:Cuticle protein n=1 Tax=Zootermopsis nevadensis TaxID=136037 RepID=A0A067R606_ZOONE|nr:Cuticle protein [Zootermopsis nevadensis]